MRVLILHGYEGNGEGHWQSWLAARLRAEGAEVSYPELPDPFAPQPDAWATALDAELAARPEVVLCHSLACMLWLAQAPRIRPVGRVALVAPPSAIGAPALSAFFGAPPDAEAVRRAATETILVHSDDDPWSPEATAGELWAPLGLPTVCLPGAGHINVDSGFGPWPAIERWCYSGAKNGALM